MVSDLHLTPVASEVSTKAADELAELLSGFAEPGILVIAGDGFEMLAAAPDVDGILDSHPQFTDAVRRFAAGRDHRVVLTPETTTASSPGTRTRSRCCGAAWA